MSGPYVQSPHSPQTPPLPADQNAYICLDPVQEAKAVLDVGRGGIFGIGSDPDARARAFAEAISQGDAQYRQELVAEILKEDPDAFNTWMSPAAINAQVDAGQISQIDRGLMGQAIAAAYNAGQIPSHETRNEYGEATGTATALDSFLYEHTSGSFDLDAQVEHAANMHEFAEFFSGPQYSADVSQFRENYANHLISQYALNDAVSNGMLRDNAAVAAAIMLNGDTTRADIAAEVLGGLDQGDLAAFMDRVANGSTWITPERLEQIMPGSTVALRDNLAVSDVALPDQFSSLVAQVSRVQTPEAQQVAADLARLPASNSDIFDSRLSPNAQDRIDAMGQLFSTHSGPILDALSEFDTDKIGSKGDAELKQYMKDGSDLGALLNVVLFNDAQAHGASAREAVLEYAGGLKDQINTEGGDNDASGRLAMLMAGADDAITQGFNELQARDDARGEMLSFIADLALAGFPVAGKAKNSIAELVGEQVFGSPAAADALKGVTGKIIDESTGRLTKEAKAALGEVLSGDEADLMDQQAASNALRSALLNGIEDQDRLGIVENRAEIIATGINTWRQ